MNGGSSEEWELADIVFDLCKILICDHAHWFLSWGVVFGLGSFLRGHEGSTWWLEMEFSLGFDWVVHWCGNMIGRIEKS